MINNNEHITDGVHYVTRCGRVVFRKHNQWFMHARHPVPLRYVFGPLMRAPKQPGNVQQSAVMSRCDKLMLAGVVIYVVFSLIGMTIGVVKEMRANPMTYPPRSPWQWGESRQNR